MTTNNETEVASKPNHFKPHVSLNVHDVDASVEFYRQLFGVAPVKHYRDVTTVHSILQDDLGKDSRMARTGYAKFDLQEPAFNFVLNEVRIDANPLGALSHLGLQVADTDVVMAMRTRAVAQGLTVRDEMAVSCCYARQDKFWLADPDGNEWEVFTVLEHLSPEQLKQLDMRGNCDSSCALPTVEPVVVKSSCASSCTSV